MRIAAVDVGTNTALLLVADVAEGKIRPVYDEQQFVRLGEGVDATGEVGPLPMQRLISALHHYRHEADRLGAARIVVGATSASRDAANAAEIVSMVKRETGLDYEILSGDEEARWSFVGAVSAFEEVEGEVIVLDVGGGSTEAIAGEVLAPARFDISYRHSVDVGAVRMTERYFSSLPPAPDEVAKADKFARSLLRLPQVPLRDDVALIGAAGTVASLAMVDRRMTRWDETDSVTLSSGTVAEWRERLLKMSYEEVLRLNRVVLSGRADVFSAGVLIIDVFMKLHGFKELRASPWGLRHGLVARSAGPPLKEQ